MYIVKTEDDNIVFVSDQEVALGILDTFDIDVLEPDGSPIPTEVFLIDDTTEEAVPIEWQKHVSKEAKEYILEMWDTLVKLWDTDQDEFMAQLLAYRTEVHKVLNWREEP